MRCEAGFGEHRVKYVQPGGLTKGWLWPLRGWRPGGPRGKQAVGMGSFLGKAGKVVWRCSWLPERISVSLPPGPPRRWLQPLRGSWGEAGPATGPQQRESAVPGPCQVRPSLRESSPLQRHLGGHRSAATLPSEKASPTASGPRAPAVTRQDWAGGIRPHFSAEGLGQDT